jgi:hypothetical protein
VQRLLNVERTSSRVVHIDGSGVVEFAPFSSFNKKWRPSGTPYANSISWKCEGANLASIDGIIDDKGVACCESEVAEMQLLQMGAERQIHL